MNTSGRQWTAEQYQLGLRRPQILPDFDPPLSFAQRSARRVLRMVERKLAATPVPADSLAYWLEARTYAIELLAGADVGRALREGTPEDLLVALIPVWQGGLPQHVRGEFGRFLHAHYPEVLAVLRAFLWERRGLPPPPPESPPRFRDLREWLVLYARDPNDELVVALADHYSVIDHAHLEALDALRAIVQEKIGKAWHLLLPLGKIRAAARRRFADFRPGPHPARWAERQYYRALANPHALYYQDGSTDPRGESLRHRAARHAAELADRESLADFADARSRASELVVEAFHADLVEATKDEAREQATASTQARAA